MFRNISQILLGDALEEGPGRPSSTAPRCTCPTSSRGQPEDPSPWGELAPGILHTNPVFPGGFRL